MLIFSTPEFEIVKPVNFTSFGLHSEHPYKSPDKDYASLEFSSVLQTSDKMSMLLVWLFLIMKWSSWNQGAVGLNFLDFLTFMITRDNWGLKRFREKWSALLMGMTAGLFHHGKRHTTVPLMVRIQLMLGEESMMINHTLYPKLSWQNFRWRLNSDKVQTLCRSLRRGWDGLLMIWRNQSSGWPDPGTGNWRF